MFDAYSQYYNMLYQDKDYKREIDYLLSLIKSDTTGTSSVLDIGCGTGLHASFLKMAGFSVTGVDMSASMLKEAREKYVGIDFIEADARNLSLNKKFKIIFSLFHVASYQLSNADFFGYLQSAYDHLAPGGTFIFDFWHGSGVLHTPPSVRIKRMKNSEVECTRIAEPQMFKNENLVLIDFEIFVKNLISNETISFQEKHRMRYFFMPELEFYFQQIGFKVESIRTWMEGANILYPDSWYGLAVLHK